MMAIFGLGVFFVVERRSFAAKNIRKRENFAGFFGDRATYRQEIVSVAPMSYSQTMGGGHGHLRPLRHSWEEAKGQSVAARSDSTVKLDLAAM